MRAAIASMGSTSSQWIYDELKKKFDEVDHLNLQDFDVSLGEGIVQYKGEELPEYDCMYLRGSYKYANVLSALTTILGKKMYIPIDPASYRLGHDKLLTHLKLQASNIPQPCTYMVSTKEAAKNVIKQVTYPVILKIPGGTHGKGVMIAESPENAKSMMDVLTMLKQTFLVQEYIETGGQDIRAIVVGDKVVAAMKRKAKTGEMRANIHAGGKGESAVLGAAEAKTAIAAAKACKAEICAVDILPSSKGPLVLEINLSPGLQGITGATKINVAEKIADFLFEKAKERRGKIEKAVITEELASEHEIHTNLDFRGNRILLPEIASTATKFTEQTEVTMKVKKGKLTLEKIE